MMATLSLSFVARENQRAFAFLLAAVTVEMIFFIVLGPLLPVYAHELHLSKLGAGILSASYAIGCGAAAIPAGALVSRVGARAVTVGGLVVVAVACGAFAVAHRVVLLDAARIIQGVGGAALWAGAIAWLMTLGSDADRGRLIGLAFSAAGVGAFIGPAVGALASVAGARPVFLGLAASILALAGAGALIANSASDAAFPPLTPDADLLGRRFVRAVFASPAGRRALAMAALPSVALGVAGVLVPLRLHQLGVATAAIAGAYVAASLVEAVVTPAVGHWYDRRGGTLVLRATLLGSMVCAAVLATALPAGALLVALVVSWPIFGSVWVPALAELTGAVGVSGGQSGLALGLFNLCWAISQSVGAVGGAQLSRAAEAAPFVVLVVLFGAGVRVAGHTRSALA
jgi:predicted MFS family arabinose efflux permease